MSNPKTSPRIAVVGLGYVGLPVAAALARRFEIVGIDIDRDRVIELREGYDRTGELAPTELEGLNLNLSSSIEDGREADIYIVTVPTPVDAGKRPDLTAVIAATRAIGDIMNPTRRPTIVYESTVYPGVTEDVCGAALEAMGHVRGRDFRLGYSPERINPGDRSHTVDKITKVIAGEDAEVVEQLADIYGSITSAGVFCAASIKAAEAAKAIENAQRDINIAFMNEVAQIANGIGLSVWDVLDAARTKWNFLAFEPGLVGGHCIGVDPFYLSHLAEQVGLAPDVVLAGRAKNDSMGAWIADQIHARSGGPGRALILGATFKENVPDLRNSKVFDVAKRLRDLGHEVTIADPVADLVELEALGFAVGEPNESDLVVGAVRHDDYAGLSPDELSNLVVSGGLVADIKGMWRGLELRDDIGRWSL